MTTLDPSRGSPAQLSDELVERDVWTDELVTAAGYRVLDVPLVSIGAGIGSFALVDVLRIAGVSPASLRALGHTSAPWETYRYLAEVSQVPQHERLRSDSQSMPGNIWGFPSYALRESFGADSVSGFLAPLWQVLTEPLFTDYYTPQAGQVYRDIDREAARIGWASMKDDGLVRMSRKRREGGYFTVLTVGSGDETRRVVYRSQHVHVAVGYPGVRFLPDLQQYRQDHGDWGAVVNAYEPHDHVYDTLKRRPGTVLVRGSGIVASRVLQRLIDDRGRGAQTSIIHLFRNYVDAPQGESPFMRRPGSDGFAYQGFNFPKGAWGGQLKFRLERLSGPERTELIKAMGGTNTPRRKLWQEQLDRGRREGFYRVHVGTVDEVRPGPDRSVVTVAQGAHGTEELVADYVIDATGLEADIREHRYLADLLDHSGAGRSDYGRLDVEPSFEIRGTASGSGRMYASGTATLGGYYAGVDSFLGLQYAALTIHRDLARHGFCRRIGSVRSVAQWWRWALNRSLS